MWMPKSNNEHIFVIYHHLCEDTKWYFLCVCASSNNRYMMSRQWSPLAMPSQLRTWRSPNGGKTALLLLLVWWKPSRRNGHGWHIIEQLFVCDDGRRYMAYMAAPHVRLCPALLVRTNHTSTHPAGQNGQIDIICIPRIRRRCKWIACMHGAHWRLGMRSLFPWHAVAMRSAVIVRRRMWVWAPKAAGYIEDISIRVFEYENVMLCDETDNRMAFFNFAPFTDCIGCMQPKSAMQSSLFVFFFFFWFRFVFPRDNRVW